MSKIISKTELPWHIVEKAINDEIFWLKEVIHTRDKIDLPISSEEISIWATNYYLYRLIAILIVSGIIKAREIKSMPNYDLWDGLTKSVSLPISARHGQEWHRKMIDIIEHYFKSQEYEVTIEPFLNHGRADLGVFKDRKKNLYVEVGTTSLDKLCLNLSTMKESIFLLVAVEDKIIEFET